MEDKKFLALKQAIESIWDSQTYYCASTIDKDGNRIPRSQFGEGWNACASKISDRISSALQEAEKDFNLDLNLLLLAEVGSICDDFKFHLNMNDIFYYACADTEIVSDDKLKEVASLFRRFGFAGLVYWVSKQRNELPQIPKYIKYVELIENLTKENN